VADPPPATTSGAALLSVEIRRTADAAPAGRAPQLVLNGSYLLATGAALTSFMLAPSWPAPIAE